MLALIVAAALVFLIYATCLYITDRIYKLPPGPVPLPLFGNLLSLSSKNERRDFALFDRLSNRYGPVMTFYMGQLRVIVLSGTKEIQEFLVAHNKTFSQRPLDIVPGYTNMPVGILFASGEQWHRNRRFSLKALRDFGMGKTAIVSNIQEEVRHFLEEVELKKAQPFEPNRLLSNAISNVICTLVFGRRFSYGDKKFGEIWEMIDQMFKSSFFGRLLEFFIPFSTRIFTPPLLTKMLALQQAVKSMLQKAIEDHRQDFSSDSIRDFPDLFIQNLNSDDPIDLDAFAVVMTDLFVAGTETTSTLLNWTLLYLSIHKDIQKKCQEEIDHVIGSDRLPDITDRPQLVYIDAVLNEVLRAATIAPLALFHTNYDQEVEVLNYDIPKYSLVMYNVWGVHHDPSYWKNPDEFDPDRWIDSDGKLLTHSTHFMPFGVGPRICPGELLAKAESFIFIVSILHRYDISLPAGATVSLDKGISGITHIPPECKLKFSNR